jgi:DtxR family transcriptional regulator, Mn-dependent transcriptional regulator
MRSRASAANDICGHLAMLHEPGYGTTGMFRTCYIDDLVVVADDIQFTAAEHDLLERGRDDCVRANRIAFQGVIGPLFVSMVERATGRRVLAFSGDVHLEPLFEVAVFRLEPSRTRSPPELASRAVPADPRSRPVPRSMISSVAHARGHSIEDYLEAIYFLVSPIGEYQPAAGAPANAARVADMLGVSRAAVGEMLKRMGNAGLLKRDGGRELVFTKKGAARAEQVVRSHRIIERFLTDFLGYSPAGAHEHADALGDSFTPDMIERMNERLGFPDRCPHGWPISPEQERAENGELLALADLQAGDGCEVMRLVEHDGELLHWYYDEGFVPGATLAVLDVQQAAGHIKVALTDAKHASAQRLIAEKAARGLIVRRS